MCYTRITSKWKNYREMYMNEQLRIEFTMGEKKEEERNIEIIHAYGPEDFKSIK